jgi:mevalonate pyrophosphate decarboxylase
MASRQIMDKRVIDGNVIPAHESIEMVVQDLLTVIKAVEINENGTKIVVNERKYIEEWIKTISKAHMDQIVEASTISADWGYDFKTTIKCKDCGEPYIYDLELNPISFFSG